MGSRWSGSTETRQTGSKRGSGRLTEKRKQTEAAFTLGLLFFFFFLTVKVLAGYEKKSAHRSNALTNPS